MTEVAERTYCLVVILSPFADPVRADADVQRSSSQHAAARGQGESKDPNETNRDEKESPEGKPVASVAGRITNAGGMEAAHVGNISAVGRTQAARPGTAGGANGAAPVSCD